MKYSKKKYRIKIIACYMGKLPEYFDLWLLSCEKNPSIDFLVISDQKEPRVLPNNVKFLNENLEQIKIRFEKCLGFKVALKSSYKLCDFRPIFGLAFKEELVGYDFWGHCDIDLIWGDIRSFIDSNILENNEKIFNWGHLSLFKNNDIMNNIFKKNGAIFTYKEVYTNNEYYAFDEITGIKRILQYNNINIFEKDFSANISRKYSTMKLAANIDKKNFDYQVFYWKEGKIYREYIENNKIKKDEFLYLHFQWKKLKNNVQDCSKVKSFYILPSEFKVKYNDRLDKEKIMELSYFKGKRFEVKEKRIYLFKLFKKFLMVNGKQRKIWLKQKGV
ncbi:DUF6625 family protein [Clostridium perfringens]|uniref:DUF6625 family protein n=1 Tax=Clostridium perfringens TaxID=1502 RepID=UPI000E1B180D|nr:DUF6625 family protein [Clostridium perfringens]SUY38500.1 Uncharacterised protein [Clostridium perfringens]